MKVTLKINKKETKFKDLEYGDIFASSINGTLWMKISPIVVVGNNETKNAITITGLGYYWFGPELGVFRKKAELIVEDE